MIFNSFIFLFHILVLSTHSLVSMPARCSGGLLTANPLLHLALFYSLTIFHGSPGSWAVCEETILLVFYTIVRPQNRKSNNARTILFLVPEHVCAQTVLLRCRLKRSSKGYRLSSSIYSSMFSIQENSSISHMRLFTGVCYICFFHIPLLQQTH